MKKIDQIIAGLQMLKECGHTDVTCHVGSICVIGSEEIGKENVRFMKENYWKWDDIYANWEYEVEP